MSNNRYHALDSLRGLASFQVVISHCIGVLPVLLWMKDYNTSPVHDIGFFAGNSPLHFIWNSAAAVIVFFVLSGFVLSLPYYNPNKPSPNYLKFFVKRILRLYIPCLVIILISLGLKQLVYKPGSIDVFISWMRDIWVLKRSTNDYIQLFLLNTRFNDIDSVLWTLPIELKLSLILPFFIYLQKRVNLFWSIALVFACSVFYHSMKHFGVQAKWGDFGTFYYAFFFALGSLMCKYRAEIIAFINNASTGLFTLIAICALLVNTYRYNIWFLADRIKVPAGKAEHYMYGIAGALFIIMALSDRAHNLLNSKLLLFMGKISFSLYLIHQVIIVALAYVLVAYFESAVIVALGLGLSIVLGLVYYNVVELPSLNLANFVSTRVYGLFYKADKVAKPTGELVNKN